MDGRGPGRVLPGGGLAGVRVRVVGAARRVSRSPGPGAPRRRRGCPWRCRRASRCTRSRRGCPRRAPGLSTGRRCGLRRCGPRSRRRRPDSRRPRWRRPPRRPGRFCGTAVQLWSWASDPQVSGIGAGPMRGCGPTMVPRHGSCQHFARRRADQYWSRPLAWSGHDRAARRRSAEIGLGRVILRNTRAVSRNAYVPHRTQGSSSTSTPSPSRLRRLPPSCGPVRLVGVDGHAGSGKSTFAGQLAEALGGAPVLHLDDIATPRRALRLDRAAAARR